MTEKINLISKFTLQEKALFPSHDMLNSIMVNDNKLYASDRYLALVLNLTSEEFNLIAMIKSFLPIDNSKFKTDTSTIEIDNQPYFVTSESSVSIKKLFDLELKSIDKSSSFSGTDIPSLVQEALDLHTDTINNRYNDIINSLNTYNNGKLVKAYLLEKTEYNIPNIILIKGEDFTFLILTIDKHR